MAGRTRGEASALEAVPDAAAAIFRRNCIDGVTPTMLAWMNSCPSDVSMTVGRSVRLDLAAFLRPLIHPHSVENLRTMENMLARSAFRSSSLMNGDQLASEPAGS